MKKVTLVITIMSLVALLLTACEYDDAGSKEDIRATIENANEMQENQPTPTDIEYSLERYNLIKRAYWVNGQREKANTLPC